MSDFLDNYNPSAIELVVLSLLIIGAVYLLSIPLSFYTYKKTSKKINSQSEEDHEDIL